MNTSWSHHRLCDLQRQANNRWRYSRPSFPDTSSIRHYRTMLKKACSAQLTKPHYSTQSIDDGGIFINLTRLRSGQGESQDSDVCETTDGREDARSWRASAGDVSPHVYVEMEGATCPG
ncbi:hypothetical protein O0L34_g2662 [Tuta absoluta]|nr:hypothetical protein O0L34_g2662 [Tuta absoluta]